MQVLVIGQKEIKPLYLSFKKKKKLKVILDYFEE